MSVSGQSKLASHTPAPWYWHVDFAGRVSLRTPDRGNLIVMDFVRRGMQDAAPRFARWLDMDEGGARGRMGGILEAFNAEHPDARLIAAAPLMFAALQAAQKRLEKIDDNSPDAVSVRMQVAGALEKAVLP